MRLAIPTALCAALSLAACEPDFPPYNELEGLRVLAVGSEEDDGALAESRVGFDANRQLAASEKLERGD